MLFRKLSKDLPSAERMPSSLVVVMFALLAFSTMLPANAAIFDVDTTVDDVDANPGDGSCLTSENVCSLRAAIQEANALAGVDTINLPAGNYLLTIVGNGEDAAATGDLDITEGVSLLGAGVDLTTIDGNGMITSDRVIHVSDPLAAGLSVELRDLTIRGGAVLNVDGGGVLITAPEGGGQPIRDEEGGVAVLLERCRIADNLADSNTVDPQEKPVGGSGGGIFNEGSLTIRECEIAENTAAANGGGIYSGAALVISDSSISQNFAEGGGGLFDTGSHISTFTDCAFVGNQATGGGGVTGRTQVFMLFENCTINGNHATDVGAGINVNGTVNLVNSTVTDNTSVSDAPFGGAGLNSFAGGSFRLVNTLLANNVVSAMTETPEVRNCGCTGGTGCSVNVQFLSLGTNLEDADTCLFTMASDIPLTNPTLAPLGFYGGSTLTRAIPSDSAAVDVGGEGNCPAADQRGQARPADGDSSGVAVCDIGAFELQEVDALVFYGGFEGGDTSRWSATVGG